MCALDTRLTLLVATLALVPLLVFAAHTHLASALDDGFGCEAPLMLVQYHKTGHDASRVIARVLGELWHVEFADVMSRPDGHSRTLLPCQFLVAGSPWQSCYGVQASPDLSCRPFPPRLRVLHFVREPVEMAISAYLYHSQSPPPEPWVLHRPPCARRIDPTVHRFAAALDLPFRHVEAVSALCHSLQPKNWSFHHALRTLPPSSAVRLAASWLITSQADVLRMAANAQSLRRLPPAAFNGSAFTLPMTRLSRNAPHALRELASWLQLPRG